MEGREWEGRNVGEREEWWRGEQRVRERKCEKIVMMNRYRGEEEEALGISRERERGREREREREGEREGER
jgi:hypothetical protein